MFLLFHPEAIADQSGYLVDSPDYFAQQAAIVKEGEKEERNKEYSWFNVVVTTISHLGQPPPLKKSG